MPAMLYFYYYLLAFTLLTAVSVIYHGWRNGITPMPSSRRAALLMVRCAAEEVARLNSEHRPGQAAAVASKPIYIIEAGSGWGGVAIALARRIPAAQVVGYENSPLPFLFSACRARLNGCSRVRIRFGDYRKADLSHAYIIVAYLFPKGMCDLAQIIESESTKRKPPTIISNTFALPGLQPDRKIQSGDASLSPIYVYRSRDVFIETTHS